MAFSALIEPKTRCAWRVFWNIKTI